MTTDEREEFRAHVRRELVKRYRVDAQGSVTFLDFARIHHELRAELVAYDMSNG